MKHSFQCMISDKGGVLFCFHSCNISKVMKELMIKPLSTFLSKCNITFELYSFNCFFSSKIMGF